MSKHTPGPWQVHGSHIYTADPERALLAQVFNSGSKASDYPLQANARLIAAAPELLEAAKLVIAWYEAEDDHSKADFYQRLEMCRTSEAALRAAIAKAEGEQI